MYILKERFMKATKRLVIETTAEEHQALKIFVAKQNITITKLVKDLLAKHMKETKQQEQQA